MSHFVTLCEFITRVHEVGSYTQTECLLYGPNQHAGTEVSRSDIKS